MFLKKLPFDHTDPASLNAVEHWKFFVICTEDGSSQVTDFLESEASGGMLAPKVVEFFASLEGMQRQPEGPLAFIGTSLCHESVAGEKIFEFRHGGLRVHWFYGEERCVVVLARAVKKASNKTPRPLAEQLKKLKRSYERAAKSGELKEV